MSAKKVIFKEIYEQYRRMAGIHKGTEIIVKIDKEKNILLAVEYREDGA